MSTPNLPELEITELNTPLYLVFKSESKDRLAKPKTLFVNLSRENKTARSAVLFVNASPPTESVIITNATKRIIFLPYFSIIHPLGTLANNPVKV
ncbi:hypothetical protein ES705_45907 [subsurface metagenome]